jgi:hypothetical protein
MLNRLRRHSVLAKLGAAAFLLVGAWQASATAIQPYIDPFVVVTGLPGGTVGWGFKIYNPTTSWVTFTGSNWAQSTPSDGTYVDFIGLQGGPGSDFAIAPTADPSNPTIWLVPFDLPGGGGLGKFVIDAGVTMPSTDFGAVEIDYQLYDLSPGNDPAAIQVGGGQLTLDGQAPVLDPLDPGYNIPTLTVNFDTPEPSSALPLMLLAAGWAGVALRRRLAIRR